MLDIDVIEWQWRRRSTCHCIKFSTEFAYYYWLLDRLRLLRTLFELYSYPSIFIFIPTLIQTDTFILWSFSNGKKNEILLLFQGLNLHSKFFEPIIDNSQFNQPKLLALTFTESSIHFPKQNNDVADKIEEQAWQFSSIKWRPITKLLLVAPFNITKPENYSKHVWILPFSLLSWNNGHVEWMLVMSKDTLKSYCNNRSNNTQSSGFGCQLNRVGLVNISNTNHGLHFSILNDFFDVNERF